MSYLPLQELFDLQTSTKDAVTQGSADTVAAIAALQNTADDLLVSSGTFRRIAIMWDTANSMSFVRVFETNAAGVSAPPKDYNMMGASLGLVTSAITLEEYIAQQTQATNTTLSNGITTSGKKSVQIGVVNVSTLNALGVAPIDVSVLGYKKIQFQMTGTFSLTMTPQVSNNGTNWIAAQVKLVATGAASNTANSANMYIVDVSAFKNFRLICTSFSSGIATINSWGVFESTDVATPSTTVVSGSVGVTGTTTSTLASGASSGLTPSTTVVSGAAGTLPNGIFKASGGSLYNLFATIEGSLTSSVVAYVKLYNKATAALTSDIPLIVIPLSAGQGICQSFIMGLRFTSGIAVRVTAGLADNDATSVTAAVRVSAVFV